MTFLYAFGVDHTLDPGVRRQRQLDLVGVSVASGVNRNLDHRHNPHRTTHVGQRQLAARITAWTHPKSRPRPAHAIKTPAPRRRLPASDDPALQLLNDSAHRHGWAKTSEAGNDVKSPPNSAVVT